ncbi:MAG TPA: hypothetical protein VGK29_17385 [Paludibaculum sp.]
MFKRLIAISVVYATAALCGEGQGESNHQLDARLRQALGAAGFTGRVESTLPVRLGRNLDPQLADLGRLLLF